MYVIWWVYNDFKLPWEKLEKSEMEQFKGNLTADTLCDVDVDDDFFAFI